MSSYLEPLIAELAEAVAQRVLQLQQAEAVKTRTIYLTPHQMSQRLGIATKTLANLRSAKKGPRFVKVGGAVRYPVENEMQREVRP